MEQQHSAHTGGKGPGQGPGQEQGQSQNQGRRQRRRRGTKARAAAAAAAPAADSGVASAAPGQTPDSVTGPRPGPGSGFAFGSGSANGSADGAVSAPREPRRRGGAGAVRQEAAALYQAQLRFPLIPAPLTDAFSWLPRARLTALGSGLLGVVLMLLAGAAGRWLLDGSAIAYGCAFIVVSVACAAWVRPTDLFAGPVAVPLAFVAGLFIISSGSGSQSLMERLTNLFPVLAVNAAWLYAGTLVAVLIVTVRKIALMVQQSRVRALMEAEDAEAEDAEAAEAEGR
ncbi:DUF6542 domain-containing protein [Streptomyces abyssalis]|uniref:DUF6542 domain-containing protein n=1 Tax=Streptomyces abyssalis TaxID=933944 RepID=UPI00085BD125|nr:DUF6542 domain-containing protein [Streptomyces abyssalis]